MIRALQDMPAGVLGFEAVVKLASVLVPGKVRAFPLAELDAAKRWAGE